MELGKNATDELYSSSKWPFLQANMKINLILDYWDARNSLLYNLITSFIDGVTLKLAQPHHNIDRMPRKSKKKPGESCPNELGATKYQNLNQLPLLILLEFLPKDPAYGI